MSQKQHTELYPGETNSLMLMSRNLNNLRGLIVNEVERLEKLKGNPTFPNSHYQEHLTEIQRQTRNILEATEVNL